jgi:hypothetical protein
VAVPSVALLWSHSVPGLKFVVWAAAILVLLCFAGVWALRLLLFALRHRRWDWWFAVAPVAGLLVAASVYSALPLQVRFAASRPAFDRVISELPPPGGGGFYFLGSRQIGSYRIDEAHHVHGGVIFSEHNGDVFHNAGFAYLPDGPTPGLANEYDFEAPAWRHLGGPWYSWTATW